MAVRLHPHPRVLCSAMWQNRDMKFKFGLAVGLVVGFILGTRAGRDRYEQIIALFNKARSNEQVREATAVAERSTRRARATVGRGLVSVAENVREKKVR